MQSPSTSPATAFQANSAPAPQTTNGFANNHDAPQSESGLNGIAESKDAITEGKERAKAVMAAAAVGAGQDKDGLSRPSSSGNTVNAVNGTAAFTRKRSRSGSRIPTSTPSSSKDASKDAQADMKEFLLKQCIHRDHIHAVAMNDQAEETRNMFLAKQDELKYYQALLERRKRDTAHTAAEIYGRGFNGFGNGRTENRSILVYPHDRRRAGHRRTRELRVARKDLHMQSEQLDELVPVRLDIELDKLKLRDTFTWNLHDRVVAPELFAETLVEDFQIPREIVPTLVHQVSSEIREQVQDFYPHVFIEEDPLDPHLPYSAYKNDEMRVLIKLNITIGAHTLVDQFEWEINNPLNNPEEFARQMAWEMSLSGEFTTAIAHSIREQCQMFTRSLYITGHPFDGRPIEDADVHDGFLQSPLPSVFRPMQSAKEYAPYLYELTEADLQREELSILREQRRQKRSVTRRGGPALPDLKDRARTVRTLVVSSVLPGAAETIEASRLFKLSRTSGRGRRAARGLDGEDSDESDSEESGPDSPAAMQLVGGTARQRTMRGAANAAQQAMRANLGRSATPELAQLHHHETRISTRRLGGVVDTPTREESIAPDKLIVKLRIGKEKFRRFLQNSGKRRPTGEFPNQPATGSTTPAPTSTGLTGSQTQINTPRQSNSALPTHSPAPTTGKDTKADGAKQAQASTPKPTTAQGGVVEVDGQKIFYYPDGRADASYPQPSEPVPVPPWLTSALAELRRKYPNDRFEAKMRYTAVDRATDEQVKLDQSMFKANGSPPDHIKFMWQPRIFCKDCPGKMYTAGPEHTVENFKTHLINRKHKETVETRRRGGG